MFKNANQAVMREIGKQCMQSHKMRNCMAVLAIALTTLLITTIFTICYGFFDTIERGSEITPGPLADGGVIAPISAYEEILGLEQVEWAAYVRPCNLGSLHNRELIGIKAVVLAPNQEFYTRNDVELKKGRFPVTGQEIAISDTMAKRLGFGMEVGGSYTLRPVILEHGKQVEKEILVTVTGIYTSPLTPLSSVYEEIYTAESFLEMYAPEMEDEAATIYVRLRNLKDGDYAGNEIDEINDKVNGKGVTYLIPMNKSILNYVILLVPLLLIMFCGYMLIYNVFYIFIVNDIRFYGLLKTIGTSRRQLKTLLVWQTVRLAAAGIVIGLALGYLVGVVAVPVVLSFTDYGNFYRLTASPSIFIFAAIFSVITVMLSCRKPYRTAMRISPVAASKYGEKNGRRKKLFTVVSFALSSVIFLMVFSIAFGYEVEAMVERYNPADVRVSQQAMLYGSEEAYIPLSHEMIEKLRGLPFVEQVTLYYEARQLHSDELSCKPANGQIKPIEMLSSEYDRSIRQGFGWMSPAENGDINLGIQGFPAEELSLEEPNITVLQGSLDEEAFAAGGYLIYNQGTSKTGRLSENGVRVGDRLALSFYDSDNKRYTEKPLEVLAVVEKVNPFPTGIIAKSAFTISDSDFKAMYPLADQMVGTVQVRAQQELTEEQYRLVERTIQESFNSQLSIRARFTDREEYRLQKLQMIMLGLFISGIFGMIGLCNVVNTLVTDVISRKIEYAAMQSIGMTRRQMMLDIGRRSLLLCGSGVLLAVPVGILLTQNVTKVVLAFSGFSLPVFLVGCALLLGIMLVISIGISFGLTRHLNKKPVVERLREAE